MTTRQRDPETGRFTASPYPCCEHCDPGLHALACASGHACPCPQCQAEPAPGIRDNPEWLAFHPLDPAGWDDTRAKYIDALNQVAIRTHHRIDQAYALILGEVPVREAPVAFIHQRGVVLELGGAAEGPITSAWQADPDPKPHPSGPLPAVAGPMPSWAADDAELDEKIKAIFGEDKFRAIRDDTAWSGMRLAPGNVPGPVEDPPTPGPGTPGEAGE